MKCLSISEIIITENIELFCTGVETYTGVTFIIFSITNCSGNGTV